MGLTKGKSGKIEISPKETFGTLGHKLTRKANANEITEDYVEIIADLIEEFGEARVSDVARRLGVTHVTVTKKIERLVRDGLVSTRPYRSLFLTTNGKSIAERSKRRHGIVRDFLLALGVSERTASADAEGIEHHVSEETLSIFKKFVKREM